MLVCNICKKTEEEGKISKKRFYVEVVTVKFGMKKIKIE